VLLSADRIFEPDHDDGSLEIKTLGAGSARADRAGQGGGAWLVAALPMAAAAPFLGLLLDLGSELLLPLGLAMLLASLALSLLASLWRRDGGAEARRAATVDPDLAALCAGPDLRGCRPGRWRCPIRQARGRAPDPARACAPGTGDRDSPAPQRSGRICAELRRPYHTG
jgi:hypothetical protein